MKHRIQIQRIHSSGKHKHIGNVTVTDYKLATVLSRMKSFARGYQIQTIDTMTIRLKIDEVIKDKKIYRKDIYLQSYTTDYLTESVQEMFVENKILTRKRK